jgi:tRNA pseudouridine38-40 synthase
MTSELIDRQDPERPWIPPIQKDAALISYVGTRFHGWQKQRGPGAGSGTSIQATIEEALLKITSEERIFLVGSGRTDSGVHASGQVIHFAVTRKLWEPRILLNGLNTLLPPVIRVVAVRPVPIEFHAQRSATHKQYSYYIQQGPAPLPHVEPYAWWIRKKLDMPAMQAGLAHLVGEHDFKAFQASGAMPGRTTVRRILEADVTWQNLTFPQPTMVHTDTGLGLIRVRLVGTGFLKQMVRNIVGTLLEVGEGRRSPDSFQELMEARDRKRAGQTAPGKGLWLEQVWYPGISHWDWPVAL